MRALPFELNRTETEQNWESDLEKKMVVLVCRRVKGAAARQHTTLLERNRSGLCRHRVAEGFGGATAFLRLRSRSGLVEPPASKARRTREGFQGCRSLNLSR